MNERVLDASALLALLSREDGEETVAEAVEQGAVMSAVNLSEVAAKLAEAGASEEVIRRAIDTLSLEIVPFDAQLAYAAGTLRTATRAAGLSLGDRACLALAQHLQAEALTCDRTLSNLQLGIAVRSVR